MQAAFLDYATLGPPDVDTGGLEAVMPGLRLFPATSPAELPGRLAAHEIVIVNKVRLDRQSLQSAPRLKLVCLAATGSDNVDVAAAHELGIAVCNVRDYGAPSVTQHVFGMILALTLHLDEYRTLVGRGDWQRGDTFCRLDYPIRELAGKTLGIVGYGNLGRSVAAVAGAFGMEVVAADSLRPGGAPPDSARPDGNSIRRLPLSELLSSCHIVSLHCPLTPETAGLIGSETLRTMRNDALLINTARGGLVDSAALAMALEQGWMGGAGIDVLPEEPPVHGDPLLALKRPNLLVTPHIAWAARESRQRVLDDIAASVRDYLAGGRRNRL